MYVLWQAKPASVLAKDGSWIQRKDIPEKIDSVCVFEDVAEARRLQRSRYSKKGVSVLGEKAFKEKSKVRKLPVYKKAAEGAAGQEGAREHPVTYEEYLDILCSGDSGTMASVVFPPANKEQTTNTPLIREIRDILTSLEDFTTKAGALEQRLCEEVRQLDLLISDRLHQSELFQMADEESVAFVKALREAQIERRRRKNESVALLAARDLLRQVEPSAVKQALRSVDSLGKQEYRCRVINEKDPFVQEHANMMKRS